MLRMIEGSDFVGIVPQDRSPVYCHSDFPEEDQIEDFMNLPVEKEDACKIMPHIDWYPIPCLRKRI